MYPKRVLEEITGRISEGILLRFYERNPKDFYGILWRTSNGNIGGIFKEVTGRFYKTIPGKKIKFLKQFVNKFPREGGISA